jgi:micrococcal nuclease
MTKMKTEVKRRSWVACLLVLSSITTTAVANYEVEARVIEVVDGNTLKVLGTDNETYTIMLLGVDCPELQQEFGEEARVFLKKRVLKKNVKVDFQGKDRWGNRLAVVRLKGEVDIRIELLKAGMAWTAERNAIPELENIRVAAQERGKGLWKSNEPTPPWIFRRQQTLLQPKGS